MRSCSARCASSRCSVASILAISASWRSAGRGRLHANALAELLGCYPVVVPANPGVLSALGFLEADFKNEFVQTFIRSTVGLDPADIWSRFVALRKKASDWLDGKRSPRAIGSSAIRSTCVTSSRASR